MTIKESTMKWPSGGVAARPRLTAARALVAAVVAVVALLAASASANAAFSILDFSSRVQTTAGVELTQAGAHPDAIVAYRFPIVRHPTYGQPVADGEVRNITVDLPVGFAGNPTATATCSSFQLLANPTRCPDDAQIGIVKLYYAQGVSPRSTQAYPVFNMEPGPGQVARFAFNPQVGSPVNIVASVRPDAGYSIRTTLTNISQAAPIEGTELRLWGVPADPIHDQYRGHAFVCRRDIDTDPASCSGGGASVGTPPVAFLTNPTFCGPAPVTNTSVTTWDGVTDEASYTQSTGPTGCDKLTFEPSISVRPDSTQADAPTGLAVDIDIPQNANPNGIATPTLKDAAVTLPEGVSIAPPEANGLEACTNAQVGIGTNNAITCPQASKIGDVEIVTPLLRETLSGPIYLAQPLPGRMFRLFLVAGNDERGLSIRLEGDLTLDQSTGQITATFKDNPALPFSSLRLRFKGGPRAPLSTPQTCGTKTTVGQLTPWADPNAAPAQISSSFEVSFDGKGAPCPARGFAPGFRAGLTNPQAGSDSSFSLMFTRNDYEQELRSIGVDMPAGLLARIKDVPLCDLARAANGTCGEESRIGSANAASGAGTQPFQLPGRVYLTDGYKGGQFGLSIVVPAVAGPFDLGTVVVQASIHVDKVTTALRIDSDPMPTILQGVPLRMRMVNVNIDRPKFMVAPTNCAPSAVNGRIGSLQGAVAAVASRFQVANCARLPFKPKMTLAIGGRGRTKAGVTTPLKVTLEMPAGNANNRSVQVTLPRTINARLPVINKACTLEQFQAGKCGETSPQVATAEAYTPLLKDPLRGPAYFVRNPARRIPDLMVALKGQVDVDLTGKVTIPRDLTLRTLFDTVPDVPITKFSLSFVAGRNGTVGNISNMCTAAARKVPAKLVLKGQNGRVVRKNQRLAVAGCGRPTKKAAKKSAKKAGKSQKR
jgi:hypothetical protein